MKQIQLKDFLDYRFLSNVRISPDQKSCIFEVSTCDEESNSYHNNLYLWKDGKCTALTRSNKDSGAVYLDKDTVLFKSSRSAEIQERMEKGEEVTEFYKISLKGGEAELFFDVPLMVSQIEVLDENTFLLLASYNKDYSIAEREERKEELLQAKNKEKDYEVFTRIPFCYNGKGFMKNTISRLYVYQVNEKELKAVSPEEMNITSFQLKPDKSEVVVVADKVKKRVNMRSGIYTYHFASELWKERVEENQFQIDSS